MKRASVITIVTALTITSCLPLFICLHSNGKQINISPEPINHPDCN